MEKQASSFNRECLRRALDGLKLPSPLHDPVCEVVNELFDANGNLTPKNKSSSINASPTALKIIFPDNGIAERVSPFFQLRLVGSIAMVEAVSLHEPEMLTFKENAISSEQRLKHALALVRKLPDSYRDLIRTVSETGFLRPSMPMQNFLLGFTGDIALSLKGTNNSAAPPKHSRVSLLS